MPCRACPTAAAARASVPTSSTPTRPTTTAAAEPSTEPAQLHPRIAQRGLDSSERPGRHRWVVERTLAWLNRFRRLSIRYERRADIHEAFITLGCALICLNQIRRFR